MCMYMYMYMYMYVYIYIHIHIYICVYRERERERCMCVHLSLSLSLSRSLYIYMYIYVYTYIFTSNRTTRVGNVEVICPLLYESVSADIIQTIEELESGTLRQLVHSSTKACPQIYHLHVCLR